MNESKMKELVERAVAGDEESLARLCEEKGRRILFTAASLMGNMHDGEEVTQEVLIKVFRKIGTLRQPEHFNVWLYRVILNECNNQRKRMMPKDRSANFTDEQLYGIPEERAEFLPSEYAEDSEKRQMLLDVVGGLRPNYKKAVLLHYYEGMPRAQVAQAMGVTLETVDSYLKRARKKIREELERRAHTKFENIFGIAAVPVVTRALEHRAAEWIPQQKINDFVACARKAKQAGGQTKATNSAAPRVIQILAGAAAVCTAMAFLSQSPLSSSAAGAQGDPQPPGASPAAAEGLEIMEPSSPMAGLTNPVKPADAGTDLREAQPAPEESIIPAQRISGRLVLKSRENDVVEGAGKYLEGVTISLLDPADGVIAQTVTDEEGRFDFTGKAPGGYALRIETEQTQLMAAEENPKVVGAAAHGGAEEMLLYVKKTFDPDVKIEFLDGDCGCCHVNPKGITVVCADELDTLQNWQVTDKHGKIVAQGDSARIGEELSGLAEGEYTVDWMIGDVAGNTARARRVFRIVDGPLVENQYE